jgi:hypothetical protein
MYVFMLLRELREVLRGTDRELKVLKRAIAESW